ncbi:ankyrin repeat-containing domain protein [Nemania abortiva]|nr:ankyrin repeat-containing domain protein [Nemania abortiva]
MPISEIVDRLKDLSFHVTTAQLEYKLNKKWNFLKKIRGETWAEIDRTINKRKRGGKDSEVIFCGKRLRRETVERETSRYRDRSIFAQFAPQRTSPPVIPADTQISVCTPQPLSMEFEWPSTLPWLRFPAKTLWVTLSDYMGKASNNEKFQRGALDCVKYLRRIQPVINFTESGVSKLAAVIGISMPESFPQEQLQRAQSLLRGSREECLYESLLIIIYGLSNYLYDPYAEDQWQAVMAILKICGFFEISNLKNLKSWTIDGFMENLFYAAIYRLDDQFADDKEIMAVLKWLFALGLSPIISSEIFWAEFGFWVPSASAIMERRSLELIRHLLEAGGDANFTSSSETFQARPRTILEIVLNSDFSNEMALRIAKLLFKHGASANLDRALHSAIPRWDRKLIELILENGGNIAAEFECPDGLVCKATSLSIAAATGLSETAYILGLLESHNPSKPITELITADVLISAAAANQYATASFLYNIPGISGIYLANDCGITPLHAAAHEGHLRICQLFFDLHDTHFSDDTFIPSPLHVACYHSHQDVVRFLITNGADVNAVAKAAYRLLLGIDRTHSNGVSVNGLTPLDMVFERDDKDDDNGSESCAIMLINAGAKLTGREVVFAASGLHLDLLSVALAAGVDPNAKNKDGISALQLALQGPDDPKRLRVVALLLQHGATQLGGEIVLAICHNNWPLVNLLLEHGGSLSDANSIGTTALEAAIQSQHAASLEWLLEIVPDVYDAGSLCAAIAARRTSTIQQLLTNRRTNLLLDELEVTAIGLAAASSDLDLLRTLLECPPSRKFGPMPIRLEDGSHGYFLRCERYNHIKRRGYVWGSPLALIAKQSDSLAIEMCSELLGNGFQADKLTWAVISAFNNLTFAQFLFQHGQRYKEYEDEEHEQYDIQSPLVCAVEHDNKELVALLLRAGVDVNDHTPWVSRSRSPLQLAVELDNLEMVHYLIEAGAEINSPPAVEFGATALQLAAIRGHLGIAKYLLDLGAEANAPPAKYGGRTALEGAAEWGRLDMLELLLANEVETTGDWRHHFIRAVKMAMRAGHCTAANLLKESRGWSKEDESLFSVINIEDSEEL